MSCRLNSQVRIARSRLPRLAALWLLAACTSGCVGLGIGALSPSVNKFTSITGSSVERLSDGRTRTSYYGSSSDDNAGGIGVGLKAGLAGLSVEGLERAGWGQSFDMELVLRNCFESGLCLGLDAGKGFQQSSFAVQAASGVGTRYDDRTLQTSGFYAVPVVQFGGEVVWAEAGLGIERLTLETQNATPISWSDPALAARALVGLGVGFGEGLGLRANFGYLRTHVEFDGLGRLVTCGDLTLQLLYAF